MQIAIVTIILFVCIGYASWRIAIALRRPQNPCEGCSGCSLKGQIDKNMVCDKKK